MNRQRDSAALGRALDRHITGNYGEDSVPETCYFDVATDLSYYGDEATERDIENYADFARVYLEKHGWENVEVTFVESYDSHESVENHWLREKVWDTWCRL